MAYDWSGGRAKRSRRFKFGFAFAALVLVAIIAQYYLGISLSRNG
jgi:hypothetical protein